MSKELFFIAPDTDMVEVVEFLRSQNCGAVVVNDRDDQVVGILTERDVLLKPVNWGTSTAADIMTSSPQAIRKSGSIARALHMMSVGGYRHLPVVHREKFAEGVLSVKDVVSHVYELLLKHQIGDQCEGIGEKQTIERYFCSPLKMFSLQQPILEKDTSSVHDALQRLKQAKGGGMFLVNDDGALTGIFTDRDYIRRIAGKTFSRKDAEISSYMTKDPVVAAPDESVHEAYGKLSKGGFRHLPILDEEKIIGMLSIKDFLDLLVNKIIDQLTPPPAS